MDRVQELLAALVREGADILCQYALGSSVAERDRVRVATDRQKVDLPPFLLAWIDAARAIALDGILGNYLPEFQTPGEVIGTSWAMEGTGEIDLEQAAVAMAMHLPDGLPWIELRNERPTPDVIALRDALNTSVRALDSRNVPMFLIEETRPAALRLRRLRAEIEDIYPWMELPSHPRHSATVSLATLQHDTTTNDGMRHMEVARLFSRDWDMDLACGIGQLDLATLGGKKFSDRVLELLLLARLRTWLKRADPGGKWHGHRVRAANNKPLYEGRLAGEPIRLWYQSSGALPPLASENEGGRTYIGIAIPDIVITLGSGETERTLIVDAKNYSSHRGMGDEGLQIIGRAHARNMHDKRVLLVRPGSHVREETERLPATGICTLKFLEMPLSPEASDVPGEVAERMLNETASILQAPA